MEHLFHLCCQNTFSLLFKNKIKSTENQENNYSKKVNRKAKSLMIFHEKTMEETKALLIFSSLQ